MQATRRTRFGLRGIIAGAVVLGLLLGVELGLRASEDRSVVDDLEDLRCWMENPHGTGSYRPRPNLDLIYRFGSDRRFSLRFQTNSFGMNWREVARTDPQHRRRIAFLGGGYVAASSSYSYEEGLVGVFDSLLDGSRYEALNFGVFGYGIDDVELRLREEVFRFEPRYVVVVVDNANDVRDSYLGVDKYDVSSGRVLWNPDVLRSKIPEALLGDPPYSAYAVRRPRRRLLDELRSVRRFRAFLAPWSRTPPSEKRRRGGGTSRVPCEETNSPAHCQPGVGPIDFQVSNRFMSWTFWSRDPYPPIAIQARDEALRILGRIHRLCEERGSELLLVAVPYEDQIYATAATGIGPNGRAYDIGLPQRHIETFARARGIPYLDLLPLLRQHASNGTQLYPDWSDQHYGPAGDALIGRLIFEFFEQASAERQ